MNWEREEKEIPQAPFRFMLVMSEPYIIAAILAVFATVVASLTTSLVPYLFKRLVDIVNGVEGLGPESVWFWAVVYIVFGFVGAMMYRAAGFAGMRWATGVRATARERLSEYVTKHSYGFFLNRFAGAIGSKLNNASEGAKNMVESLLFGWLSFFLKLFVSLGLVLYTNIYVGLIFLAWLVFITPINVVFMKRKIPMGIAAQERETELRGQTVDILTNIGAMHDYARRLFEMQGLRKLIDIRRRAGLKNWMFGEIILTVNSVLETLFVGGMILVTVYLWDVGTLTAGDIILVLSLVVSVRGELAFIGHRFNNFAETISEVKEGLEEILAEHEVVDAPVSSTLNVSSGEIVFDDVSFRYERQDIFSNLNLTLRAGERVGLVGRSGAGKSTLMKLVTRQYDLTRGKILIDGQNISLVTQESLRDAIAVVPQDPLLFHRSLMDNIRYGKLEATDEEVMRAAEHAQAHVFIDALPNKYETLVGERGVKLSGGERQRVAIARAFLKDAKILLLDEATSSLDSESELTIQRALEELMEEKTVIAIAHRLSTLRAMDRILVVDQGQVIEDGTHDELLKLGGVYAELWSHQAGGFLQDE